MRTESKMLCIHGLAGIDGHEDDQYQTSVKSRTGYVQIFGKYHLISPETLKNVPVSQ